MEQRCSGSSWAPKNHLEVVEQFPTMRLPTRKCLGGLRESVNRKYKHMLTMPTYLRDTPDTGPFILG